MVRRGAHLWPWEGGGRPSGQSDQETGWRRGVGREARRPRRHCRGDTTVFARLAVSRGASDCGALLASLSSASAGRGAPSAAFVSFLLWPRVREQSPAPLGG